ncbi:MAG: outer rane efflux protein [Acidobacteria bacterium]|nr:outer rane efflux protein [Acidobacteriota bacterium]
MFRTRTYMAAICAMTLAARPARAQTTAATMTIEQAVAEALDHNLSIAAERYNVAVADARVVTAGLRPNPVLTASAMLPDAAIFDSNVNPREGIVRGDVLLERGGKRAGRIEVAQQGRASAALQLQNAVRTLTLSVESACIDVQQTQSDLQLARESLAAFNAVVAINTERVRTGDLAPVELARSRLAALQFQNDVRSREAKLAVAAHRLRALLGRTDTAPIVVTGELRRDAAPSGADALQQRAFERRPDLQALERDQARSLADIRLQLAQGRIDYTVSAEFHHQLAPNALSGNEWGLFVSAPIPLFNRNQGEAERARQEARQAAARIAALRSDITTELRSAWEQYAATRELVDTIEQQMLGPARDVRDTTAYSYQRGDASFIEFLDAQRTFNDAMQGYNEARAEYARSLYTLDALAGGTDR